MLTFTEEVLLLLGDEEGALLPVDKHAFDCALAGAALLDLAFAYRIDTDLQTLVVTDPAPTGMPFLDRILAKVASRAEMVDGEAVHGIKLRIEEVLSDNIPDPRDVALLSLADACQILPDRKLREAAPRIALLRKMDLIRCNFSGRPTVHVESIDWAVRRAEAQRQKGGN